MTRQEAWEWADAAWLLHDGPTDDWTLRRVQDSLRRLKQLQLPVLAINEITTLLRAHEEHLLNEDEDKQTTESQSRIRTAT